jgi:hypothetical protein
VFKTAEPCWALIERTSGRIGDRVTELRLRRGYRVRTAKTDGQGHLGEKIYGSSLHLARNGRFAWLPRRAEESLLEASEVASGSSRSPLTTAVRIRAPPAAPRAQPPTSGNGAPSTLAVDRSRRGSWEPDALKIRGYLCRSISAAISAVS